MPSTRNMPESTPDIGPEHEVRPLPVCPVCGERIQEWDEAPREHPVRQYVGLCHQWCADEVEADYEDPMNPINQERGEA